LLEVCGTAIFISLVYNLTRIILKAMELSYLDRKNEKEGRYMN